MKLEHFDLTGRFDRAELEELEDRLPVDAMGFRTSVCRRDIRSRQNPDETY